MIKSIVSINLIFILFLTSLNAQTPRFNRQDTLRGSITPERAWWDLSYYHLSVQVNPEDSSFKGKNLVGYRVLDSMQRIQIDLQPPMKITEITQNGKKQEFKKDGNAWFVSLSENQIIGELNYLMIKYQGKPQVSKRPPWEGGVSWGKDKNGNDFICTANQGDGASLWWPCKDHPYDEPDSMLISIRVPEPLIDVSNGRLRNVEKHADGTHTFHWFVSNPINNYGVNINIGDYVHFEEIYDGEKGALDCDYWVLRYNIETAKEHFKQVPMMLEAFEYWFGPYPFYEDGYKLVEVSYPGMEHQSSVTYGNGYENGYGGRDVSHTGYGMKFDFIIIHESGHEWFANNITNYDAADMWIHESFTAYSENLFVDYFWGKEASADYCRGTRLNILNDRPVVGEYNMNYPGSSDMYSKGANMLHTLRQIIDNDEKWREILRGLNEEFYHQTVQAYQIENFISQKSEINLKPFFDQYLRDSRIPMFEYAMVDNQLKYRWANCVPDFNMKLKAYINGELHWLEPTTVWKDKTFEKKLKKVIPDQDFYIGILFLTDIKI